MKTPFSDVLKDVLRWAATSDELVILYLTHFEGDGCQEKTIQAVKDSGIYYESTCSALVNLTVGGAKAKANPTGKSGNIKSIINIHLQNV